MFPHGHPTPLRLNEQRRAAISLLSRLMSPLSRSGGWKWSPDVVNCHFHWHLHPDCSYFSPNFWRCSCPSYPGRTYLPEDVVDSKSPAQLPSSTSWMSQNRTMIASSAPAKHSIMPDQTALNRRCRRGPNREISCIVLLLRASYSISLIKLSACL